MPSRPEDKIIARDAATWWADQLCGNTKQDAGIDGMGGAMLAFSLAMQSKRNPVSDEARVKFIDRLSNSITASNISCLDVDYGPDYILSDAASVAGIRAPFPIKTIMFINETGFSVRHGYGAEAQVFKLKGDKCEAVA